MTWVTIVAALLVFALAAMAKRKKRVRLVILDEQGKEVKEMDIQVDKKRVLSVAAFKEPGHVPLPITDVPVWTVSPLGIIGTTPSPDGLTCDAAGLAEGTATVTVEDMGATTSVLLTVVAAVTTVRLEITVGPEVDL